MDTSRAGRWSGLGLGLVAGVSLILGPFLPWFVEAQTSPLSGGASYDAFGLGQEMGSPDDPFAFGWLFVGAGVAELVVASARALLRGRILYAAAVVLGALTISLTALAGVVVWIGLALGAGVFGGSPGIGVWLVVVGGALALAAPLVSTYGEKSDLDPRGEPR